MEEAVRRELDALLGYMRTCRTVIEGVAEEAMPWPPFPSPTDYIAGMTWAQARGALMVLEHLRLITSEERAEWESRARAIVQPPS